MAPSIRIGFIGIGLMGHGMAKNLIQKGYPLTVHDMNPAAFADLLAAGATEAANPKEVAERADIVFLSLPTSKHIETVVLGKSGVIEGAHEGMIVVDTSTGDPNAALRIAEALAAKGVRMADAPLARTPKEAEEGRLNVMVGADDALFAEIKPVLEGFAENIFHVGPLGAGLKVKLINNFVGMSHCAVVAEAVTAAAKVGVDIKKLFEVISAGGANSAMFGMVMPYVLENDDSRFRFSIANAAKDVRYYLQMANDAKMVNPLSPAVVTLFSLAEAAGHGADFSPVLCDVVAGLNGIDDVKE